MGKNIFEILTIINGICAPPVSLAFLLREVRYVII
jgi:hypothetical protein